jgi:GntP family gluconate:H+ symporter
MNDSGFWVVSRLSGFTEKETLKTWTVLLTIVSVVGLLFTLLLSMLFPFKQ